MIGLIDCVGGGSQSSGRLFGQAVGHLFYAARHNYIVNAASHSNISQAQRRPARSTRRLDLDRLDASQPSVIGYKRSQVLLRRKLPREHIAYIERLRTF